MSGKKIISFLVLATALSASNAHAENIFKRIFNDFVGPELCPVEIQHLPDMKVEDLYNQGLALRQKGKFCDAARYFSEARFQYPGGEYYKKSWLQLIGSYMDQKDYVLGINEANLFLDQRKGAAEIEDVHYTIMKAVRDQSTSAGKNKSQEWTEYALDINKTQSKANPFLHNLSYQSFIDAFPQSQHLDEIKSWQVDARNQYCAYYIEIGRYYFSRGEYLAAIMRYNVILQWGPQIKSFPEAMYEMVRSQKALALAILDPSRISDAKLKEISRAKDDEVIDRKKLSDDTLAQVQSLIDLMHKNLPDNAWTKLADNIAK